MSREIQQSNKAPRHHNDNFESDKRFIETVAELRLSLVTVFSFVSCLVSCSNEKVVNNNNYSEQEKAKIEALMKLFDSYGWELDTTVSIEQRDKELLEMDYERAKTFLEYMSNGIEFDNFEPTTPSGKIRQKP